MASDVTGSLPLTSQADLLKNGGSSEELYQRRPIGRNSCMAFRNQLLNTYGWVHIMVTYDFAYVGVAETHSLTS
jgi:hypothetical protein